MRQDQQQRPFVKYFPELSSMFNFLDDYSICEKHYNQIIVKSHIFFKKLQEDDILALQIHITRNSLEDKFFHLSLALQDQDLLLELENIKKRLIEICWNY